MGGLNYMKGLCVVVTAFLWSIMPLVGNPYLAVIAKKRAANSSYLVEEDFQETGVPTAGTWTSSGTIDWDNTTPDASQWAVAQSTNNYMRVNLGSEYSELWVRFRCYVLVSDTSSRDFLHMRDSSLAQQLRLDHRSSDLRTVTHGSAEVIGTGMPNLNFMASATICFIWVRYVAETTPGVSADGVLDWYLSDTGTRPASPSFTYSVGTGDGVQYVDFFTESATGDTHVDDVTISETELDDFP